MPGWHKLTEKAVAENKLQVVGIVQEQHPDRAALFMQWQQMSWPLLSDPFNELGISVVPITLLIDEHGIIRYRKPSKKDLSEFLTIDYPNKNSASWKNDALPKNITALSEQVKKNADDAPTHFSLGVAYRNRYDSPEREKDDFATAVYHWKKALELNPNQYIWRRRIQQYGPRLDKPYSFYDWVSQARKEITARGEIPLPLSVEPSGAEFAKPQKSTQRESTQSEHPDPNGKISTDEAKLIAISSVEVPSTNPRKSARRFHLTLSPSSNTNWTNDAGEISVHLLPNTKAEFKNLIIPPAAKEATSNEERILEFEIHPKDQKTLPKEITVSLFYYICTKDDHSCQYLRQDLRLSTEDK